MRSCARARRASSAFGRAIRRFLATLASAAAASSSRRPWANETHLPACCSPASPWRWRKASSAARAASSAAREDWLRAAPLLRPAPPGSRLHRLHRSVPFEGPGLEFPLCSAYSYMSKANAIIHFNSINNELHQW